MKKAAVIIAPGFEEGEALTIIDIIRRAELSCDSVGLTENVVTGAHDITMSCDKVLSKEVCDYDMIVLPGGRPGGANLKNNPEVIQMVKYFAAEDKYVAAMCSGTLVLSEADIIRGREVTGYTGYGEKMPGAVFKEDVVVADGKLITSQGPATVYPFSYKLAEILGRDVSILKERMLYNFAGGQ